MELQQIKLIVERHFGMNINVKSRERYIVDARRIYFNLCRDFTKKSLMLIGRSMDRDHATALHNIRSSRDLRKTDPDYNKKYIDLYRQVSLLDSNKSKFKTVEIPKYIHPGRFRYGKTKSLRKIFDQRGQITKQRNELH